MPRPVQNLPTVAPGPSVRAFQTVNADPSNFGGALGQGLAQGAGTSFEANVARERAEAHEQVSNAESPFIDWLYSERVRVAEDMKTLPADQLEERRIQFARDVEAKQKELAGSMTSELAKVNFKARTIMAVGSANRAAGMEMIARKRVINTQNANATFDATVELAGNVHATDVNFNKPDPTTPGKTYLQADIDNYGALVDTALKAVRVDLAANGATPIDIDREVHKREVLAVTKAMQGYLLNPTAAKAFLDGTLPDGRKIYDPNERIDPADPNAKRTSVLTQGEYNEMMKVVMHGKKEKTANGLAEQWKLYGFGGVVDPVTGKPATGLDGALRGAVKDGTISMSDVSDVRAKYNQAQASDFESMQRAHHYQANALVDTVVKQYGANLTAARQDPKFLKMWLQADGTAQTMAINSLAVWGREDPGATAAYLKFLDRAAKPGWTSSIPAEQLESELNGLGAHRNAGLALAQADKLDKEKEAFPGQRAAAAAQLDYGLREVLDFKETMYGENKDWTQADYAKSRIVAVAKTRLMNSLSTLAKNAANDPKLDIVAAQSQMVGEILEWTKAEYKRTKDQGMKAVVQPPPETPLVHPAPPAKAAAIPVPTQDGEIADGAAIGGDPNWTYVSKGGKWVPQSKKGGK